MNESYTGESDARKEDRRGEIPVFLVFKVATCRDYGTGSSSSPL